MKQIRIWVVAIVFLLGLSANRANAQTPIAMERLYFSFFNDYENDIQTNSGSVMDFVSLIRTVSIINGNVQRAIYYDLGGEEWTNLVGMEIVREVNMTNGAEGIYLRGYGRQTNISYMFTNSLGESYLNGFTSEATNEFPGLTNNFDPDLPIHRGSYRYFGAGNPNNVTNHIRDEQMFYASFTTTNLKFNYIGYGTVVPHPVIGRLMPGGTIYSTNVNSFTAHGIGTLYHIGGTNIFGVSTNSPITTNTGVMYGGFWSGEPFFFAVTNANAPQ